MPWHTYIPFMQNHFDKTNQEIPQGFGFDPSPLSLLTIFTDLQDDPLSFGRSCRLLSVRRLRLTFTFRFCGVWQTLLFSSWATYRTALLSAWKTNLWASADQQQSYNAKEEKAFPDTRVSGDTHSMYKLQVPFCFVFIATCMFSTQS